MKGEITLDGAIALLSSEKIKDRTDGLAGLFIIECFCSRLLTPVRFETYSPAE